jgi:hypothetical protein
MVINRRFVLAEMLMHEKTLRYRVIVTCKTCNEIAPGDAGVKQIGTKIAKMAYVYQPIPKENIRHNPNP